LPNLRSIMVKLTHIPKVAVLVETSRVIGRGLLEGISQYMHRHGSWSVYHDERTLHDGIPRWIRRWKGDGILARLEARGAIRKIQRMGVPVVDLLSRYPVSGVPTVTTDEWSVARMAADHLLELGFRQFAYCGFGGVDYSEQRCRCFIQYLAERGYEVNVYGEHYRHRASRFTAMEAGSLAHEREVGAWLLSLPKPLGLMACNDIRGQQVLNTCKENDILVPDEVAVVGADNDVLLCQLSLPSLSSIEFDSIGTGYEAARMLDQLMHHKRRISDAVFRPLGVVARQSTDAVATADKDVVAAVQFIRHRAAEGIGVDDVVEAVSLSRSTLERRFASTFGRTVTAEIDRVKLNRVKELLTRTDWTLRQIADEAGFQHIEPLCRLFKRKLGLTLGEFRKRPSGTFPR
jgi:LacI family transcriptional regulator